MELTMNHVKVVRKEVGMKQYVLAEMLNVDQSNYANIENGKLITSKVPDIIHNALSILIPELDNKILETKLQNAYLKQLRKEFKNY